MGDGRVVEIAHFFSVREPPGKEPRAAVEELRQLGFFTAVDEELSGDGDWHIGAFAETALSTDGVASWRRTMESLAQRHQLVYGGWNKSQSSAVGSSELRLRFAKSLVVPIGLVVVVVLVAILITR